MWSVSPLDASAHIYIMCLMLGQVHLWMCGEDSVMNAYAQPSVLPDPVQYMVVYTAA